jgi:hypothetical protein
LAAPANLKSRRDAGNTGRSARFASVFIVAALLSACHLGDRITMFDDDSAILAVAAIQEKVGHPIRALNVTIDEDTMTIRAQDPASPSHVDEYNFVHYDWQFVHWESLSGPKPVQLDLINPNLEQNLFDLSEIDFASTTKLAAAAIKRAALEDPAHIASMHIERQLHLLPSPSSGDVTWTIDVKSGCEQAAIFATPKAVISGVNLDGTLRAQTLDMMAGGQPLADAARDIRAELGSGPVIRRFMFANKYVWFTAPSAQDRTKFDNYSWNLNGVSHTQNESPVVVVPGLPPDELFSVDEVNWSLLPQLKETARRRLEMPQGAVTDIKLSKPATGVGSVFVIWEIEITDQGREKGTVVLNTRGDVQQVVLPKNRRPPVNMFDARTMQHSLDRIMDEFGASGRIEELLFDAGRVLVTARDPRTANLATFIYDNDTLVRAPGGPLAMLHGFQPDWLFTSPELTAVVPQTVAQFQEKALSHLKVPGGKVDRITVSLSKLLHPANTGLLIQIDVEGEQGKHGWVLYDLTGRTIGVMTP